MVGSPSVLTQQPRRLDTTTHHAVLTPQPRHLDNYTRYTCFNTTGRDRCEALPSRLRLNTHRRYVSFKTTRRQRCESSLPSTSTPTKNTYVLIQHDAEDVRDCHHLSASTPAKDICVNTTPREIYICQYNTTRKMRVIASIRISSVLQCVAACCNVRVAASDCTHSH